MTAGRKYPPAFDPESLPVIGADSHLPAVPTTSIAPDAMRRRFVAPPTWQPEVKVERRFVEREETHGRSGLTDRVRASGVDEAEAERQVLDFLQRYVRRNTSPMCGNSICQDRRFLAATMPKLEAFFHYRNLDVSTLKELARRWRPELLAGFRKHQAHTALADIHESIDELAYYREHFLRAEPLPVPEVPAG